MLSRAREIAARLVLGVLVVAPGCVGASAAAVAQDAGENLPVTGAIVLLVSLGLAWRTRSLAARGQTSAAGGAALGVTPVVAVLAHLALERPIDAPATWSEARPERWLFAMTALALLGGLGALLGHAWRARRPGMYAGKALGVGALVVGVAMIRWGRFPDPDAAGYLSALPIAATLPPLAGQAVTDVAAEGRELRVQEGSLAVTRRCSIEEARAGQVCRFVIDSGRGPFEIGPGPWVPAHFHGEHGLASMAPIDLPMVVKHAAKVDAWFVEAEGFAFAAGQPGKANVRVPVRALSYALAPPLGWILCAALSQCLAAVCWLRARRAALALGTNPSPPAESEERREVEREAWASTSLVIAALGVTPLVMAAAEGMLV